MDKIAILVDTAADISLDIAEEKGIYLLPLYVNLNSQYLKDRVELSPGEFYDWIKENKSLPKTSTASPGDVLDLYKKIKEDGYNKLIAISINSKFSSTYNVMTMEKVAGLDTYVFDSGSLTLGQGLFAIMACEMRDEGKSFEEIIKALEAKKGDSRVFFTIESFKYIVEGGRLPRPLGRAVDAFSVRPVLTIDPKGQAFKVVKLARGDKKVLNELRKNAENELKGVSDYYFFVGHGGYEEGLAMIEEKLSDIIQGARKCFRIEISPTLGANTGPGLFGFGLMRLN